MQKQLLFALVALGIPAIALAANVGDCLNAVAVDGEFCDAREANTHPCGPTGCVGSSGDCNASGDGLRNYKVMDNIKNFGFCQSTYFSANCTKCGQYHCATFDGYKNKDLNDQCNGSCSIGGTTYQSNKCVLP